MTAVITHRHLESADGPSGNLLSDIAQPQDPQFLFRQRWTWLPGLSPLTAARGCIHLGYRPDNRHQQGNGMIGYRAVVGARAMCHHNASRMRRAKIDFFVAGAE